MTTKPPVTRAVHALRDANIPFTPHLYRYELRGGTKASSAALGVSEHATIKTLILEDDTKSPMVMLMHGDREVSLKGLARVIGAKRITPCAPAVADRHSGYQVGGTSPFGLKRAMPIYVERTILELERIYINGGARGFLVEIDPRHLHDVLQATPVDVATAAR